MTVLAGHQALSPVSIEVRHRLARRRRRADGLRSLIAVSAVTALALALLAVAFFSLIGR